MSQVRRSASNNRGDSGRFDILVIIVIALLLVGGLIFVLLQIIGHSEEHVETVRKTKVFYKESLRWRPDSDLCETRIKDDLAKHSDRKVAEYTDLNLNENCIKLIGRMSKLEKLNLDRSTIRNQWLRYLLPLQLQSLSLEGNPINDDAIPYIQRMQNLKRLSIGDTEVTDKGLEMLSSHGGLTTLALNLCRSITNDGIKHIGKMRSLRNLELTNPTSITGKCLVNYTDPEKLINLNLDNMTLTADDVKSLPKFTRLNALDLSNCQLTDPSMAEISKLSNLTSLSLTGSSITGKGLMLLTKLKKLAALKVKDCPYVDVKALEKYRSAMPRCFVEYSTTSAISDKMSRKDVKQEVEFLQDEVRQEFERTKNDPVDEL